MRERALANSGKTFTDTSTNTSSKMGQSHDQSHGGAGLKHFSSAAVQTECIIVSSEREPTDRSLTTQPAASSRTATVQTEAFYPNVQAEMVSVCVQTEAVQLSGSVEERHSGDSQSSLRGRKTRGEGGSHKRSLSEGTSLVQRRRGREHVSFLEENGSVLSASQSVPGLSQVCGVCVHRVCIVCRV